MKHQDRKIPRSQDRGAVTEPPTKASNPKNKTRRSIHQLNLMSSNGQTAKGNYFWRLAQLGMYKVNDFISSILQIPISNYLVPGTFLPLFFFSYTKYYFPLMWYRKLLFGRTFQVIFFLPWNTSCMTACVYTLCVSHIQCRRHAIAPSKNILAAFDLYFLCLILCDHRALVSLGERISTDTGWAGCPRSEKNERTVQCMCVRVFCTLKPCFLPVNVHHASSVRVENSP